MLVEFPSVEVDDQRLAGSGVETLPDFEPVCFALRLGTDEILPPDPHYADSTTRSIAHAVTRFEGIEIVRFHIGHQSGEPPLFIFRESARHSDRVQSLPTVAVQREAFLHVYVLGIELQNQVIGIQWRCRSCVPAIAGDSVSVEYGVTLVAFL